MNFTVTILGSGAAIPLMSRHCSAQAVNINGFRMLVDCGESTQNQIRHAHQKMQSFSTIFISHLHGDHFFGLPGLLSTMHMCGRTEPVTVFAPKGIKEALLPLFQISGSNFQYELNFVELDFQVPQAIFENARCRVTAFPLLHSVPTYGFLFEEQPSLPNLRKNMRNLYQLTPNECYAIKQGADYVTPEGIVIKHEELTTPPRPIRRYAYCCDTGYTNTLIPNIKNVDLLCVDCTFDSSRQDLASEKLHCTTTQAATLALKAGAKKLMLTHFSARYKDITPLIEESRSIFPNVIAAEDDLVVEV